MLAPLFTCQLQHGSTADQHTNEASLSRFFERPEHFFSSSTCQHCQPLHLTGSQGKAEGDEEEEAESGVNRKLPDTLPIHSGRQQL